MGGRPGRVATERYTMQRDSLGIEFISLFMERKGKGEGKKREKGEKGRRGKGGRGYLFRRGMERERMEWACPSYKSNLAHVLRGLHSCSCVLHRSHDHAACKASLLH